jgi:Zn-dependent alcohol dehydrogenases
MGFNTVAIARGKDKEAFAKKLGAHHYIDSQASDPAAELNKLGGAKVVIATVTNAEAMAAVLGGLRRTVCSCNRRSRTALGRSDSAHHGSAIRQRLVLGKRPSIPRTHSNLVRRRTCIP